MAVSQGGELRDSTPGAKRTMSENYNATGGMDGRQDGATLHGSNQLGPHLINCKGNYDGHCEAPLENVLCLHQLFAMVMALG